MRDADFDALASGATAVTASRRQARRLRVLYAGRMQRAGRSAWPTPDILTWEGWLERTWREQPARTVLLTPEQETRLWETVIADSDHGDFFAQSPAVVRMAQEAWRLSWDWGVAIPAPAAAATEDVRAFAHWAEDFDRRCRDRRWQDRARLAAAIEKALADGRVSPPPWLLLFGFDEPCPQQQRLLDQLSRAGARVEIIPPVQIATRSVERRDFSEPVEELWMAARWARGRLEAGYSAIGVVVPELATLRAQVVRIFEDVFAPGQTAAGAWPFNLSLGTPLADDGLVCIALRILRLGSGAIECEEVGGLLRSPFIDGAVDEWAGRALLDVECRKGEPLVSLHDLLRAARGLRGSYAVTRLIARLAEWRTMLDRLPRRQLPSAWTESFARELAILGWPGDRPLDSGEYQTVEAWRELLGGFSSLDAVTGKIDRAEALLSVRRLATERIFQPRTPDSPVQILGLLDAAGLEFDCLWISGLHDGVWPPSARPNPFIAAELQRRRGLPHASAARELDFARRVTERLLGGAGEAVVSHARRKGDEEWRPSPLIAHLPLMPPAAPGGPFHPLPLAALIYAHRPALDCIEDSFGRPLEAGVIVRRGTSVFKDQAACPFRAFAHARLGARALDKPAPGLDAADRGRLLHRVMEKLWRELESHARLVSMDGAALEGVIGDAAAAAVADMARERPQTLTPSFAALERARLQRLVLDWLELERQRMPFTVLPPETDQRAVIGGLTIRMVPDRIDELADGSRIVIDYKTGTPKLAHWFGDRPDEPQLPLYSLTQPRMTGLAFARLRRGDRRFIGVAAQPGVAPGIEQFAETKETAGFVSWSELLTQWRRVVEALGAAFLAGDARVDPRSGFKTCEHCDLHPLCRIAESEEAV